MSDDGRGPQSRRMQILTRQIQRMDFESKLVGVDPATGNPIISMVPDPRRYTICGDGDDLLYIDKFTHVAVSHRSIVEAGWTDLPIYALSPTILSALGYARERRDAVAHQLRTGDYVPPADAPRPHRALDAAVDKETTFLSVDIVGATALRGLDAARYDATFDIFIQELATTVGHFASSVLKTTGDGFIAYNDVPSVRGRDNAVDLGLTLLLVLATSVNPSLAEAGLPCLSIRIGADHGPARTKAYRVPTTGYETIDIVSDALNRAVKLQEAAPPGELLVGEALYNQLHVGWLERAQEVDVGLDHAIDVPGYRTFIIR